METTAKGITETHSLAYPPELLTPFQVLSLAPKLVCRSAEPNSFQYLLQGDIASCQWLLCMAEEEHAPVGLYYIAMYQCSMHGQVMRRW